MKSKRRWLVLVSISPLLILVVAATIQIGMRIRQDNLDQTLIHAVGRWDAPEVTALLKQGAKANARESELPAKTLPQMVKRLVAQFQQKRHAQDSRTALDVLFDNLDGLYNIGTPKGQEQRAADDIAVALIGRGGITVRNSEPGLYRAARDGMPKTIRLLLSHGANVDERFGNGLTPLMFAGSGDDITCVQILLDHGANVNAITTGGYSVLFDAAYSSAKLSRCPIMRLLVMHGAHLTETDKVKLTEVRKQLDVEVRKQLDDMRR